MVKCFQVQRFVIIEKQWMYLTIFFDNITSLNHVKLNL